MKKEKLLILWSGGIDSTSNLKSYLEKTEYDIIVHHIVYNCGNSLRQKKELESINKLLPILNNIRKFKYVQTLCEYQYYPRIYDITMLFTLSIPIALNFDCNKIVIGFVADIRDNQKEYIDNTKKHLDIISESFCRLNNYADITPKVYISEFIDSKYNYIINLGDIINDVWFCRGYKDKKTNKMVLTKKPCGKCHTCQHVKKSIEHLVDVCISNSEFDLDK